jgi:hypothetical protein
MCSFITKKVHVLLTRMSRNILEMIRLNNYNMYLFILCIVISNFL